MPAAVAVLVGIPVALIIGAALIYILGFIVSMVAALFYEPIEYVEEHLPHTTHHHHRPVAAH